MPRFDNLDRLGDAIGNTYADCVDRLLVNIARHFRYLQPGEEPGGAFGWQARKLADGLEQAIMDALSDIEEPLRKAAEEGLIGGGMLPAAPDPRAMQAFTLYHGQSLDGLNLVNSRMLESTAEAYRGMVADITNRLLNARGTINAATGEVLTRKQSTGLFPASLGRWEETLMDDKALKIVRDYIWEHLDKSDELAALNFNFEVYVVWKAKALQNWKYLIFSTLLDGMYYELTYNGDKQEWYLDAYKKFENRVIPA